MEQQVLGYRKINRISVEEFNPTCRMHQERETRKAIPTVQVQDESNKWAERKARTTQS